MSLNAGMLTYQHWLNEKMKWETVVHLFAIGFLQTQIRTGLFDSRCFSIYSFDRMFFIKKRNLKFKVTKPNNLIFMGDGNRLARAFGNLIKNAINYGYENTEIEIEMQKQYSMLNSYIFLYCILKKCWQVKNFVINCRHSFDRI